MAASMMQIMQPAISVAMPKPLMLGFGGCVFFHCALNFAAALCATSSRSTCWPLSSTVARWLQPRGADASIAVCCAPLGISSWNRTKRKASKRRSIATLYLVHRRGDGARRTRRAPSTRRDSVGGPASGANARCSSEVQPLRCACRAAQLAGRSFMRGCIKIFSSQMNLCNCYSKLVLLVWATLYNAHRPLHHSKTLAQRTISQLYQALFTTQVPYSCKESARPQRSKPTPLQTRTHARATLSLPLQPLRTAPIDHSLDPKRSNPRSMSILTLSDPPWPLPPPPLPHRRPHSSPHPQPAAALLPAR